jgi:DNA-binding CsgD family transcriptional regulator
MKDIEKQISQKVEQISQAANEFPGVVIIHNIQEKFNKIEYMSPRGANILGLSLDELKTLGADYYTRFFNEEDAKDYVPKMIEMVQRNNEDEIYSFFQQVRRSSSHPWTWYHSSTRILMKDENSQPLLSITFAVPIDPVHHLTNKVSRLLDENNFLRLHFNEFASLTKREKEIVKQLAKGESSAQIAKQSHISVDTLKTHRKNIYKKLNIKTAYQLLEYARAFDLL